MKSSSYLIVLFFRQIKLFLCYFILVSPSKYHQTDLWLLNLF